MQGRKNAPEVNDDFDSNLKRTINNIINISRLLSHESKAFKQEFDTLCQGRPPSKWSYDESLLIMQSYQLIFQTLSKLDFKQVPVWKIPGYTYAAMWYYDHITDHATATVEYYLAAASVSLHYPVEKIGRSTPLALQQERHLDKFNESAEQAIAMVAHVETLLLHSPANAPNLDQYRKQLAQCYRDISLVYQAAADYDLALLYAAAVIRTLSSLPLQDKDTLFIISETYRELAITFKFNDYHYHLFSFMKDFFSGSKNLYCHELFKLEFNCQDQSSRKTIFSQCLHVIDAFYTNTLLPASPFKLQLQEDYFYKRYAQMINHYPNQNNAPYLQQPYASSPLLGRHGLFGAADEEPLICEQANNKERSQESDSDTEIFIPTQDFVTPPPSPRTL